MIVAMAVNGQEGGRWVAPRCDTACDTGPLRRHRDPRKIQKMLASLSARMDVASPKPSLTARRIGVAPIPSPGAPGRGRSPSSPDSLVRAAKVPFDNRRTRKTPRRGATPSPITALSGRRVTHRVKLALKVLVASALALDRKASAGPERARRVRRWVGACSRPRLLLSVFAHGRRG
jgi:hypothetical protein